MLATPTVLPILTQNKRNTLMRRCSWNLTGGARLGPSMHCLWLVLRMCKVCVFSRISLDDGTFKKRCISNSCLIECFVVLTSNYSLEHST